MNRSINERLANRVLETLIVAKIILLNLRMTFAGYIIVAFVIPMGLTYLVSLSMPWIPFETKVNFLTGMLVLSSSLTVINGVGQTIAMDRVTGSITWYRTSPISPLSYVIGIALTYLTSIVYSASIVLVFSVVVWGLPIDLYKLLIVYAVNTITSVSLIGIGATIGTRARTTVSAGAVTNILSFIFTFLTPAYYSIDRVPKFLLPITYLLPTTPASLLIKNAYLQGSFDVNTFLHLLILSVAYFVVGVKSIKWKER